MYLRKSRAEEGLSVDELLSRHRETLERYAAEHGIQVAETFREVKSGESLVTRPEMLRLLEAVEAGRFGAVLCMDLDRLSRGGTRDRGLIWEAFKDSNTLIVTPSKTYDLNAESDEMLVEFGGLVANMELRQIKKRLQRGRVAAVRDGAFISIAPYGYQKAMAGRKCTLKINEPEAHFVRLMFDWYANGTGATTIARRLNEMGARPRQTREFSHAVVLNMIANPVYMGKVRFNRRKWTRRNGKINAQIRPESEQILVDGLHPAIVDAATWEKCQSILRGRYKPPANDGTVKTPLAGLVRCRKCGRPMNRILNGNVYRLHCKRKGCCPSARYEVVERRIIEGLAEILSRMEFEPDATVQERIAATATRLESIRKAVEAENRKKARLYDLLENGVYDVSEFTERMSALKERVSALESSVAEAEAELDRLSNVDERRQAEGIRSVLGTYEGADIPTKNALLKAVVEVIWYEKDRGAEPDNFRLDIFLR